MKTGTRAGFATVLLIATMAATLLGTAANAQTICIPVPAGTAPICIDTPGEDPRQPCREGRPTDGAGEQGHDPLCASGPAECIAYGLFVSTDPAPGLPSGASASLARSHASASAFGYGGSQSDSDAATQRADLPGTLGEGVVESSCAAASYAWPNGWSNYAWGSAETGRLFLDLNGYGAPVTITADVLRESGWAATGGAGSNTANIADVSITVGANPPILVPVSALPNTAIALPGGLGTLYLNEQIAGVSAFGCPVFSGDALRLVVNRPVLGGTATVIVSWVSNAAC